MEFSLGKCSIHESVCIARANLNVIGGLCWYGLEGYGSELLRGWVVLCCIKEPCNNINGLGASVREKVAVRIL